MPTSVAALFAAADLAPAGVVRWREPVPEGAPGVYAVALSDDPTRVLGRWDAAIDERALDQLLAARPGLRLDGERPTAADLARRLRTYWLPDEPVLYCGLAGSSLRERVGQYYRTPLGARKPHAGGWWLKTLTMLDDLCVHWAPTSDSAAAEKLMLNAFASSVTVPQPLHDPERVAPFANLRCGDDRVKRHGIHGATGH